MVTDLTFADMIAPFQIPITGDVDFGEDFVDTGPLPILCLPHFEWCWLTAFDQLQIEGFFFVCMEAQLGLWFSCPLLALRQLVSVRSARHLPTPTLWVAGLPSEERGERKPPPTPRRGGPIIGREGER